MNNISTCKTYSHEPTSIKTIKKIRDCLDTYLSDSRLEHTLSVEKQAHYLCDIYFPILNIDDKYKNDIICASLVHDLTKNLSLEHQLSLCKKYDIELDDVCCQSCALIHSKTSAYQAQSLFNINNFVFNAVYYHTTGKPDMNIFEKIVFISDYIEPTRTHEQCVNLRDYFYNKLQSSEDKLSLLDDVIKISLDNTISYLLKTNTCIDLQTVNARNHIIQTN